MKTLKDLLEEYHTLYAQSTEDLSTIHPRFHIGKEMLKKELGVKAEEKMKEYQQLLLNTAVLVLVSGPNQQQYANMASEESGGVTIDGSQFYKDIAIRVNETMGDARTFSSNQWSVVTSELRILCDELGLKEFSAPYLENDGNANTLDDVVNMVTKIIEHGNGTKIQEAYVKRAFLQGAIAKKITTKVNPVFVTGIPKQKHQAIQDNGSFGLKTGLSVDTSNNEVSKEDVLGTFELIRNKLKGKY